MTFRLLTYNIKRGGRSREAAIAAVVNACRPDVVVLQEARDPAVVAQVAAAASMEQWGARSGESLGFMSRRRVRSVEWHRPRVSRHAFIDILPGGADVRVFGLHLSAVHAAWTERRHTFELRALLAAIAAHQHGPHVLTGDFNTLAPGELLDPTKLPHRLRALVWLSGGKIHWRTIQIVLDGGYVDGYRRICPTGPGFTFPTWDPHVRLDYVFLPAAFAARLRACEIVKTPETADASDHFPLLAEIDLP